MTTTAMTGLRMTDDAELCEVEAELRDQVLLGSGHQHAQPDMFPG
jgi:hypothetical protein